MERMIALYDSNNEKIGETFVRRAKQLIKQQRAAWTDEDQNAIRFFSDVKNPESIMDEDESIASDYMPDDSAIIALAKKRIEERRWFITHTVAFMPGWFLIALFCFDALVSDEAFWFFTGCWLTFYALHLYQFGIPRIKKLYALGYGKEERRERILAKEIANLRSELKR